MGIRPSVWALIVLVVLAGGAVLASNLRSTPAPGPALAGARSDDGGPVASNDPTSRAAAREARAAGAASTFRIGTAAEEGPAEARLRAALDGSRTAARRNDGARRANDGASPGGDDASPGGDARGPGAAPAAPAAPAAVDRDLERAVARFGQELDLPTLPRSRTNGPREEALGDEGYVSDVADAAMVEFLVRQELWETFHAQSKLVPWGYPIGRLREAWAVEVAALPVAERNRLLAIVEQEMPRQSPPIMSRKVEYEGGDFEGQPSGVEIFE